jgi:ligand-binding sensor domain-containing protein
VGTDARAFRSGFTRVSEDLKQYDLEEGPTTQGFGFHGVRSMVWRGRQLWAATDLGLWTVEPGGRVSRRDTGLPDDNLFALAQGSRGVWVGTALGLALVPDNGAARGVAGIREPVLALSAASDSLWIGAASGLWFTWAGDSNAYAPANVAADGSTAALPVELRDAIVAVTRTADTVIAATVDRLVWRAPGRAWTVERVISTNIGPLFAAQGDTAGVWVGGARGLAFFRFRTKDYQIFTAPGDVPGAVHGIALSGPYLWVATEGGLVRFLKRSLIP